MMPHSLIEERERIEPAAKEEEEEEEDNNNNNPWGIDLFSRHEWRQRGKNGMVNVDDGRTVALLPSTDQLPGRK